jgi:hypothetical protein
MPNKKTFRSISLKKEIVDKIEFLLKNYPEDFLAFRINSISDFVEDAVIMALCEKQQRIGVDVFKTDTRKPEK